MANETRVKICGITNIDDAMKAVKFGAWALGFIFYKDSPRFISPSKARRIIDSLPPFVTPVGVFVNQREGAVRDICRFTTIQTLQFHGDEDVNYCARFKGCKVIKAFRVGADFDYKDVKKYQVSAYLFDAYQDDALGGTGKTFNWDIVKAYTIERPFILSGGLTVENVRSGIDKLRPYAVDVSSSVEKAPGLKDHRKVQAFIDMARFNAPVSDPV